MLQLAFPLNSDLSKGFTVSQVARNLAGHSPWYGHKPWKTRVISPALRRLGIVTSRYVIVVKQSV